MIKILISKYYSLFSKNRINIIKTLVVNFTLLPFDVFYRFPVIIYGKCHIHSLKGKIELPRHVNTGMIKIGLTDPSRSIREYSYLFIDGILRFNGKTTLRRGIKLQIARNGLLEFDPQCTIGDNCSIYCYKNIFIGENTRVGNNSVFMDTDFHYIVDLKNREVRDNKDVIIIGDNSWIGGWCTIKKGTKTPTGTVIAGPYSMTSKDYRNIINPFSIIGGSPAKLIREQYRRVKSFESEILLNNFFSNSTDSYYILNDEKNIDVFCAN